MRSDFFSAITCSYSSPHTHNPICIFTFFSFKIQILPMRENTWCLCESGLSHLILWSQPHQHPCTWHNFVLLYGWIMLDFSLPPLSEWMNEWMNIYHNFFTYLLMSIGFTVMSSATINRNVHMSVLVDWSFFGNIYIHREKERVVELDHTVALSLLPYRASILILEWLHSFQTTCSS